jgi:hypothetical protein
VPTVALLVLAGLVGTTGAVGVTRWARRMVAEPGRYMSAVAPLGRDRRFHRLAGAAASARMRRLGLGALGPLARRATVSAMRLPGFDTAWVAGHRVLHLRQQLPPPDTRVARRRLRRERRAMVGTALLGTLLHPISLLARIAGRATVSGRSPER